MTTALIDNYMWCALQVTLLAVAGALLYLLLRRQTNLRAALPQWFLAMVVFLSLLFVSPWPSWSWFVQSLSDKSQSTQTVFFNAPPELDREQLSSLKNHGFQIHTIPSEEKPPTVGSVLPPIAVTAIPTRSSVLWERGLWKRGFVLLAGASCLLATVRLLFAWRELKKRLRLSVLIEEEQLQEEFSSLYQQYSLPRPVALRESPLDELPATVGWLRPVILLPPSWREWTPEQRSAVLAHELAHIEHHDFATWLAAQLPLLLHSYHPLVHWFARQLRWEQEISADRRAIEVLGDHESYLAALAELALEPTKKRRPRNEYSLAPSSSMLLRRLQMLRSNRSEKARKAPRIKRLLLLASLCTVLLGVSGLRAQAPNKATTATITAMVMLSPPPAYDAKNNAEIFWETQFSLIKSQFILKSVIEQPQIADVELIQSQEDPVVWLQKELQVSRIPDSPVLRFQFQCPGEEAAVSVKIVDALLQVYKQDIEQQKILRSNDSDKKLKTLTKLLQELSNELRKKIEIYHKLAEELGGVESTSANAMLNMLLDEIRLIKSQIYKKKEALVDLKVTRAIAEQQAKNGTHKADLAAIMTEYAIRHKSITKQIAQLEREYEEIVKAIKQKGVTSGELAMLDSEIVQLQKVKSDMEHKLRSWAVVGQTSMNATILMPATVTNSPTLSE